MEDVRLLLMDAPVGLAAAQRLERLLQTREQIISRQ